MSEDEKAENEVEVTPEMIAAGAQILMQEETIWLNLGLAVAEDLAERIIREALLSDLRGRFAAP